jgi:hypothetical protein
MGSANSSPSMNVEETCGSSRTSHLTGEPPSAVADECEYRPTTMAARVEGRARHARPSRSVSLEIQPRAFGAAIEILIVVSVQNDRLRHQLRPQGRGG